MKKMYILRGLPGSGKSTKAHEMLLSAAVNDVDAEWCSADHYFIDSKGNYNFNRKLLGEAHTQCYEKAADAVIHETPVIVIDNTNMKKVHMQRYVDLAEDYGYDVEYIVSEEWDPEVCYKRCVHNVPLDAIIRMKWGFEP